MKKTQTLLLVLLLSIFAACKSPNSQTTDIAEALRPVDDLLSQLAGPSQFFTVPADKPSDITGAKGTIIHLDPAALETLDGSPLGKEIKVELREVYEKSELVLNRATTTSGGELLETGGMYYIDMSSSGKPLKIKEGSSLEVEFPQLSDQEMSLFTAERDDLGRLDWVQVLDSQSGGPGTHGLSAVQMTTSDLPTEIDELFTGKVAGGFPTDSTAEGIEEMVFGEPKSKKQKRDERNAANEAARKARADSVAWEKELRIQNEKAPAGYRGFVRTYNAVNLVQLGWVNCDRFNYDPAPRVDVLLAGDYHELMVSRIFAVFADLRAIMEAWYQNPENPGQTSFSSEEEGLQRVFEQLPEGRKLTVVAVGFQDGQPQYFEEEMVVKQGQALEVKFSPTTPEEIERRMRALK